MDRVPRRSLRSRTRMKGAGVAGASMRSARWNSAPAVPGLDDDLGGTRSSTGHGRSRPRRSSPRSVPPDPGSHGQGHTGQERECPGEARQVRLHVFSFFSEGSTLAGSAAGRSRMRDPGFASPPRDGFALDDPVGGGTSVPRSRWCGGRGSGTSHSTVLGRSAGWGSCSRAPLSKSTSRAAAKDDRRHDADDDEDIADAEHVREGQPGRHREDVGQRPDARVSTDELLEYVVGSLFRGRPADRAAGM